MNLIPGLTLRGGISALAAAAFALIGSAVMAQQVKEAYAEFEGGPLFLGLDDGLSAPNAAAAKAVGAGNNLKALPQPMVLSPTVGLSFAGVSQFDLRNMLGGSFIPPDTMGAVGKSQFMETTNGVYAIYSKTTGALQSMLRADTFWGNAAGGAANLNGDARVMYDAPSQRWIAMAFGAKISDIQIAVSTTSDATGPWRATSFTGFNPSPFGGVADYPTLAIDGAAVYIGTNNFRCPNAACTGAGFRGTTMNVIARDDLLGAGAPTAANVKQFNTPFVPGNPGNQDGGFAIQGVNSTGPATGMMIAASLFSNDVIRYDISNPGTAGATKGAVTFLGTQDYAGNGGGRQPDGTRNIDTLDERIGASAWAHNGKIYSVYTATPLGGTHTEVRFLVVDAVTNAIIQQGSIANPNYDFYEGSLAINSKGQVVIGYNRSGFSAVDGSVRVYARTFDSLPDGSLTQTGDIFLHESVVSDYHNGSVQGAAAVNRQRWGDYSAVTLDPEDDENFWIIGEYAEAWNNANGCSPGHPPGCTRSGGSTWGTWIAEITLPGPIPEPHGGMWVGLGLLVLVGLSRRRA